MGSDGCLPHMGLKVDGRVEYLDNGPRCFFFHLKKQRAEAHKEKTDQFNTKIPYGHHTVTEFLVKAQK